MNLIRNTKTVDNFIELLEKCKSTIGFLGDRRVIIGPNEHASINELIKKLTYSNMRLNT